MSFVLDNSVALAWCFEDEQTPAVMDLLDRVVEAGAVAPLLWPLEALNGLLMAERRRRIDAAKRARFAALLRALPIMLDLDTVERAWAQTIRLSEKFTLSIYDATYLELAERRRLPLASLDRRLRDAATAAGLEVLGM
ncbi:MAG: type II toxin-antitoxin system VapC family toxin [Alphaproteobacteria bacterium]